VDTVEGLRYATRRPRITPFGLNEVSRRLAAIGREMAWYYRREPRPGVSVIGARLAELALDGRG
jgi:hypothetical protein